MTVADIHKAFKVALDKNSELVAFGGCPAFLPEETDLFLNLAFVNVIFNKITGDNTLKLPFEGTVKRVTDLQRLVKRDTDLELSKVESASNAYQLTNFEDGNFKRLMYVSSLLKFGDNTITVDLIDHEHADRFKSTYNNLPWIDTPVAVMEDDNIIIYIDPVKMASKDSYKLDLTYIKYPDKIVYTEPAKEVDEVPEYILYEVINRAALLALENIESSRLQMKASVDAVQE